jgi:8-oxo-dGTP pyrophosphatase MutT (NUDIX family)
MNPQDSQIHFWVVAVDASIAPKGTLQRVSEPDRPGPGEEINDTGVETVPRQAATVIVLRGGSEALELLLVKRNPASRFMGGAWVFPGGAVDPGDGDGAAGLQAAARRECAEEAGVPLPDDQPLVPYSRWITPRQVKIRFDTWFFLVPAPPDAAPRVDGAECVGWRWAAPEAALDAHRTGELEMVFPTIKHLEQLAGFASADALLEFARGQEVRPVEPRVVMEGETARIVLPGEPGY